MTIFCIALAVILISGVFTMADMEYRHEIVRMMEKHGNWHITLKNITKEEAEAVSKEAWIKEGCWYDVVNYDLAEDYSVDEKQTYSYNEEQVLADPSYISEAKRIAAAKTVLLRLYFQSVMARTNKI